MCLAGIKVELAQRSIWSTFLTLECKRAVEGILAIDEDIVGYSGANYGSWIRANDRFNKIMVVSGRLSDLVLLFIHWYSLVVPVSKQNRAKVNIIFVAALRSVNNNRAKWTLHS